MALSYCSYLNGSRSRAGWLEVGVVLGELNLKDGVMGRRRYGTRMEQRVEKEGVGGKREAAAAKELKRG